METLICSGYASFIALVRVYDLCSARSNIVRRLPVVSIRSVLNGQLSHFFAHGQQGDSFALGGHQGAY